MLIGGTAFAQDPTPTLTPTPVLNIPAGDLNDSLAGADTAIGTLPGSVTAPNGTSFLSNVNFAVVFGYIKWVTSPSAQDELAGPFGQIIADLGILLAVRMAYLGVYALVYLITFTLRWGIWIAKFIMAVLNLIAVLANSIIGKIAAIVGL